MKRRFRLCHGSWSNTYRQEVGTSRRVPSLQSFSLRSSVPTKPADMYELRTCPLVVRSQRNTSQYVLGRSTPKNELQRCLPCPGLSPIVAAEPQPKTVRLEAIEEKVPVPVASAEEWVVILNCSSHVELAEVAEVPDRSSPLEPAGGAVVAERSSPGEPAGVAEVPSFKLKHQQR